MNPLINNQLLRLAAIVALVTAGLGSMSAASEPAALETAYAPTLEPANWQEPAVATPLPPNPTQLPATMAVPPEASYVQPQVPLLDYSAADEEITPPSVTDANAGRRGVKPYGGGHPSDWSWGCNGSPFRTGPGFCDTWEVGCRWDVAVDGIVMSREDADLAAIEARMRAFDPSGLNDATHPTGTDDALGADLTPTFEQFSYGPGGRVWMTSKLPCSLWQMHVGYEGIEEWNSSVVFPKQPLDVPDFQFPVQPVPLPPDPFAEGTYQRALHYRSSLHSGELNFVRQCGDVVRPYCGVRYMKFDDEINDFLDQQAQPPLAGPRADMNGIGPVSTTDRLNLFDVENNLIGFQIGLRHDLWRPNQRMAIEGFVNSGVYYNKIKYTNFMGIFTEETYADNTSTAAVDESRIDFSDTTTNDVRELNEISYMAEASISGVCRLNKCWALRAGYQAMWVTNVHMAEDAFLDNGIESRDLFFHGWHAGVEHRR